MQYGWETIYSASMFFLLRPDPSSPNCSSTGTSRAGAKFLQSHHDKHPQFITLHYRNRKSNTYQRTNPDSNSCAPTMVRPLHNNNCGRSSAWPCYERARACVCVCVSLFLCMYVCVWSDRCPHPPRASTRPPRRRTSIPQLPPCLPPCLPSILSFFIPTNGDSAGGYDVRCVLHKVTIVCTSCIFPSWLRSSVQTVSYTYGR